MSSVNRAPVVGVFASPANAQKALTELRREGFSEAEIGVVSQNNEGKKTVAHSADGDTKATEGAAAGMAAGAGVGALWAVGIAAGLLPAIGPVIAGGIFASILASAAGGAAAAGLAGALIGLGIPEDDAKHYETELKSGRTIITVANGPRATVATEILASNGGVLRGPAAAAAAMR
jgi:hypothetical protein